MASFYWIGDDTGRVLGPLTLEATRQLLASGRLRGATRVSRDGRTWSAFTALPELRDVASAAADPSASEQVARLRERLRTLEGLPAEKVFGVRPGATVDELRGAFFGMARPLTPDRLGPDASAELKQASKELFDLLSRKMREAEARLTPAARTPTPPPAPAARPAAAAPPAARPGARGRAAEEEKPTMSPTYSSDEFVGLQRRDGDRLHVDVRVTVGSVGMFTDHRVVNLSSGGMFVASQRTLPIGTELDLTLHFESPPHTLKARGRVIWENALDARQPRGFGVRLVTLTQAERKFLQEYVQKIRA